MKTTRIFAEPDTDGDDQVTAASDRRVFDRLPPQFESIDVRTRGGTTLRAKVENVSLGGICLRLDRADGIDVDEQVELIYLYVVMPAVVRYVETYPDGATIAGLEWSKPPAV